jgi:hypothetical protein
MQIRNLTSMNLGYFAILRVTKNHLDQHPTATLI